MEEYFCKFFGHPCAYPNECNMQSVVAEYWCSDLSRSTASSKRMFGFYFRNRFSAPVCNNNYLDDLYFCVRVSLFHLRSVRAPLFFGVFASCSRTCYYPRYRRIYSCPQVHTRIYIPSMWIYMVRKKKKKRGERACTALGDYVALFADPCLIQTVPHFAASSVWHFVRTSFVPEIIQWFENVAIHLRDLRDHGRCVALAGYLRLFSRVELLPSLLRWLADVSDGITGRPARRGVAWREKFLFSAEACCGFFVQYIA